MRISHILYKVKDKEKAVKQFEELGFTVTKGGYNYNIWFEDGSFIEIFSDSLSGFVLGLLKLFGKKSMANKFSFYKNADYGFMEYALETDALDLEKENNILKKLGYKFNSMQMKKKLENGKKIKWKITFPYDLSIPFYCGDLEEYTSNRRPDKIEHKNGAKKLSKLVWGVPKEYMDVLDKLNEDPRLELVEGNGFKSIEIEGLDFEVLNNNKII